jgi:hypothetical protein
MFYFEHGTMDELNNVTPVQRTLPIYKAKNFASSPTKINVASLMFILRYKQ